MWSWSEESWAGWETGQPTLYASHLTSLNKHKISGIMRPVYIYIIHILYIHNFMTFLRFLLREPMCHDGAAYPVNSMIKRWCHPPKKNKKIKEQKKSGSHTTYCIINSYMHNANIARGAVLKNDNIWFLERVVGSRSALVYMCLSVRHCSKHKVVIVSRCRRTLWHDVHIETRAKELSLGKRIQISQVKHTHTHTQMEKGKFSPRNITLIWQDIGWWMRSGMRGERRAIYDTQMNIHLIGCVHIIFEMEFEWKVAIWNLIWNVRVCLFNRMKMFSKWLQQKWLSV